MSKITLTKILSIVMSLTGAVAAMKAIPGVSPEVGASLIGLAAAIFKVSDLIEAQMAANSGQQIQPVAPAPKVP